MAVKAYHGDYIRWVVVKEYTGGVAGEDTQDDLAGKKKGYESNAGYTAILLLKY